MKTKLLLLAVSGLALLGAQTTQPVAPTPALVVKPRKKAVGNVQALKIPASAVKTPEGSYRFVDAKGKVWLYRETPWGVSRVPETPEIAGQSAHSVQTPFGPSRVAPLAASPAAAPATPAQTAKDPTADVTATASGETINFAKPTPFGVSRWQKSKNELTPEEQKVWDREQAKRKQ